MSTTPAQPSAPRDGDPAGTGRPAGPDAGPLRDDDVDVVAVTTVDDDEDLDEDLGDLDDDVVVGAGTATASLPVRLGGELLGTFAFVLVLVGVAVYTPLTNAGVLGVALAGGLALAGLTAALGHVTGAHLNPAVTFGSAVAGRTRWADVPVYWLGQLLGALTAVAVLFITVPQSLPTLMKLDGARGLLGTAANGWGAHSPLSTMTQGQTTFDLTAAFVLEAVATAVVVGVVLGTTHRRAPRSSAPIAVGVAYGAMLLLVAPVTAGGLNPARSTAVALFTGAGSLGQLWLFWVAPFLGAALVGFLVYAFGRPDDGTVVTASDDELLVTVR